MADYTIPVGINPSDFFKGLNDMDARLAALEQSVAEANKAMRDGFGASGQGADELARKIKADTEAAIALRATARGLGKEIAESLSGKGTGKALEEKLSRFQDLMFKAQQNAKVGIDVVFNEATIKEIANAIASGSEDLKAFNLVLDEAKQKLAALDPGTEEFKQLNEQIQLTEGLFAGLAEAETIAETGTKSLKLQLRELKAELAEMEAAGLGGTEEFNAMAQQAGELEDQIGDVAARVRVLASDSKYLDASVQAATALAGGFAAAQGAAALLGDDSEELQKVLLKVNAAMSILQGLQAVAAALNKDSALSVLLLSGAEEGRAAATVTATAATEAEAAATVQATVATEGFTAALLANPFTAIAVALAALVAGIYTYIKYTDDSEEQTKKLNDALERQNELLALDEAALKRRGDLLVARLKAEGKAEEEIEKAEAAIIKRRIATLEQFEADKARLFNEATKNEDLSLEEFKKFQDEYLQAQQATADARAELQVKEYDNTASANKRLKEQQDKAVEDAKKRAEDAKKAQEQVIAFRKILQDAELAQMKDGFDKQREEIIAGTKQQIEELNNQQALTAEAIKVRNESIVALNKAMYVALSKVDKDEIKQQAETRMAGAQMLVEMRKDSLDKELAAIDLEKKSKELQINEQFKDEAELRKELIESLGESTDEKRKQIALKYRQQEIDEETEKQVLIIEMISGYAEKPIEIEEEKQRAILRVQIDAADKRLKALTDSGAKETDLAILQAKGVIAKLNQELKDVGTGKEATWFSILGLDKELTADQKESISKGVEEFQKAFSAVNDLLLQENKIKSDASDKKIKAFDDEISELEDSLKKEYELRKEGLANNTALIEQELAEKEEQREREIENRKRLFEEQKNIQRAQLIADTISQASSLVTASANIIEGFSTIPIVGTALGIAAVGAMIAGFLASKYKAFEAVNNQQLPEFGEGGWIEGKSHSQGGVHIVAEGDEFVVSKGQAKKYADLLEAINNDAPIGLSDLSLHNLLSDTGVSPNIDDMAATLLQAKEHEQKANHSSSLNAMPINELRSMDRSLSYLATSKKSEVTTWEDNEFYYHRKGNRLTKKRK